MTKSETEEKINQSLAQYIYHALDYAEVKNCNLSEDTPERIINSLVGSGIKSRKGGATPQIIKDTITTNLKTRLAKNEAICISLALGCAKTTQKFNAFGVDLAELLCLENLIKIRNEIKNIYDPGVEFNISLHDSWWMFIYDSGVEKVNRYCDGIEEILNVLGQPYIKLTRLSQVIKESNNEDEIFKTAEVFSGIFKGYWTDSERVDECEWETLTSYKKLVEIGWKGLLPSSMRKHYLQKVDKTSPNASYEEKITSLCRYFAFGRVIDKFDLSKRSFSDIDLSYISLPPGVPKTYMKNRLFVRSMPFGVTKKQVPPWTCAGIIELPDCSPKIVTDYERDEFEFIDQVSYRVENKGRTLRLSAGLYRKL